MPVYLWEGDVLTEGGAVAVHEDCCCGGECGHCCCLSEDGIGISGMLITLSGVNTGLLGYPCLDTPPLPGQVQDCTPANQQYDVPRDFTITGSCESGLVLYDNIDTGIVCDAGTVDDASLVIYWSVISCINGGECLTPKIIVRISGPGPAVSFWVMRRWTFPGIQNCNALPGNEVYHSGSNSPAATFCDFSMAELKIDAVY